MRRRHAENLRFYFQNNDTRHQARWLHWRFGGVLMLASVTTLLKVLLAEVLVTPLNVSDNMLDQVIVDSINQVAHCPGALTMARFVEDDRNFEQLRKLGVDYAQGYYIHRPQPMAQLH